MSELRRAAGAALAALLAGCASFDLGGDERVELATEQVAVLMHLDDGVPLVDVRIQGKGPFLFKLDTGSGPSVIAERLAARLQLPTQRVRGTLTGANGKTRDVDRVAEIASLQLSEAAAVADLRAVVLPTEDLDVHDARRPVEGILGFSVFAACTLTLDYQRRTLVLSRTALPAGGEGVQAMTIANRTPRVEIALDGQPLDVLVDTGNDQGLIVPEDDGAQLPFVTPPAAGPLLATVSGMTRVRIGRLAGELQLGEHRVQQPLISLMPCSGAMLGAELLRHFKVTLDPRSGRARFARASAEPVRVGPRLTDGLGLRRQHRGWQVVDVIPGSPAAAAGIRTGDTVRAIDYLGEGSYRIEVGQHGVYRAVDLRASVLVE